MKYLPDYEEFKHMRLLEQEEMNVNSELAVKQRETAEKVNNFNAGKGKLQAILNDTPDKWEDKAAEVIGNNQYLAVFWDLLKLKKQQMDAEGRLQNADEADKTIAQQEIKHYSTRAKELENRLRDEMNQMKQTHQ